MSGRREIEVWALGEWDWWILPEGQRLHAGEVAYDADYDPSGQGKTACGRNGWMSIPSIFTRMDAQRCQRCCTIMGYPQGTGSPKNDARCRPMVEQRLSAERARHRVPRPKAA